MISTDPTIKYFAISHFYNFFTIFDNYKEVSNMKTPLLLRIIKIVRTMGGGITVICNIIGVLSTVVYCFAL